VAIASRRRIAPLIRIRQELEKRLDSVLPFAAGARSLEDVLTPAAFDSRVSLREALARSAGERFPLKHLRHRAADSLPARSALLDQALVAAEGNWTVFKNAVQVSDGHDWMRHPISGASASGRHWSRVPYVDGVGGGDVKLIWELSRHAQLVRIAQGYYLTRDRNLAERSVALIDQWIAQNPAGCGINWVSSLEVAFRAIAWCWIWSLTCDADVWTEPRLTRFLVSLWHHARHIERFDSIHHSPNTHLTGEGLGLLYVGLLFPELERAPKWAERGREILETELAEQVLSDGMHFERSVGYHRYTAEFYLHYLLLAEASGLTVAPNVKDRVRSQVAVTALLRRPDGTWSVIGDEDGGDTLLLAPTEPEDQGAVLAVGGAYFGDAAWMQCASDAHRAAGWWLLSEPHWSALYAAPRSDPAVPRSGALPEAGYYVGRDGGGAEDWWCLVDAGPHGGDKTGHAHTDLAHVEIVRGNRPIVTDPGCAGYTIDVAARNWARSESAHACLVVDGAPLAVPAGPFSWERIAPTPRASFGDDGALWWCELWYDRPHGERRLAHRRQVILARGHGIVVCDWIDGNPSGPIALHWPLGAFPESITLDGGAVSGEGYRIWWADVSGGGVHASLEPMVRSPGYARQMDGRLLRLRLDGQLPASVITAFVDRAAICRVRASNDGIDVTMDTPTPEARVAFRVRPGAAPSIVTQATPELSFRMAN